MCCQSSDIASLSSCNDTSSGWRIEAEAINISEVTSRGHIEDLRLKILDKTVLRLPYLPFPATTKRLSGFLEPELNFTSDGLDLFLPYFWVLSKHSDITLAPRILKKRGSGLEVNYRYLSNNNTASENYLDLLFFCFFGCSPIGCPLATLSFGLSARSLQGGVGAFSSMCEEGLGPRRLSASAAPVLVGLRK